MSSSQGNIKVVAKDITAGSFLNASSGNIQLTSDTFFMGSTNSISATVGAIEIASLTPGRAIELRDSGVDFSKLTITSGELGRMFSNFLRIGSDSAGPVAINTDLVRD